MKWCYFELYFNQAVLYLKVSCESESHYSVELLLRFRTAKDKMLLAA